jgi:DNA-directed RNA polymerase sigma subunit (sigma70/sigma32)
MFNSTDVQYTPDVESEKFSLEHYFLSAEVESILTVMVNKLNKTDSYIITALCCGSNTIKAVAKEIGVSAEKVRKVKSDFCRKARAELSEYYGC